MSDQPILFVVKQDKRDMRIEWQIADVRSPGDFLYWALEHGARYEMRLTIVKYLPTAEFIAKSGCAGEYAAHMCWDPLAWCMVRKQQFGSIHYLVHHGLDGLPAKFLQALPRDVPVFEIMPPFGGLVHLTMDEWLAHYDDHSKDIGHFAISKKELA